MIYHALCLSSTYLCYGIIILLLIISPFFLQCQACNKRGNCLIATKNQAIDKLDDCNCNVPMHTYTLLVLVAATAAAVYTHKIVCLRNRQRKLSAFLSSFLFLSPWFVVSVWVCGKVWLWLGLPVCRWVLGTRFHCIHAMLLLMTTTRNAEEGGGENLLFLIFLLYERLCVLASTTTAFLVWMKKLAPHCRYHNFRP